LRQDFCKLTAATVARAWQIETPSRRRKNNTFAGHEVRSLKRSAGLTKKPLLVVSKHSLNDEQIRTGDRRPPAATGWTFDPDFRRAEPPSVGPRSSMDLEGRAIWGKLNGRLKPKKENRNATCKRGPPKKTQEPREPAKDPERDVDVEHPGANC